MSSPVMFSSAAGTPTAARTQTVAETHTPTSPASWKSWAAPAVILGVLAVALLVLRHELAATGYHRIALALAAIPLRQVGEAVLLTVVAYALLTGYDVLALRAIGAGLSLARTVLASLLAYALSQTLGFPLLSGGAVRVRFWSGWGLGTREIAQATAFVGTTFSVGVAAVCGLAFLLEPSGLLALMHVPVWIARSAGIVLLGAVCGYVALAITRHRKPLVWRTYSMPLPSVTVAVAQVLLSLLDWMVAGVVLYVLLPVAPSVSLVTFLGVFSLAQLAGVVSHVPGGVGVFETLMVLA